MKLFKLHLSLPAHGRFPDVAPDGTRIGFGPLSAGRQTASVPDAAIRLNVFQPADILLDGLPQFPFDFKILSNNLSDFIPFFRRQFLGPLIRIYLGFRENFPAQNRADSINIAERHFNAFIVGDVYADNSHWVKFLKLSLSLLMFRGFVANHINPPSATDDFAVLAYFLY